MAAAGKYTSISVVKTVTVGNLAAFVWLLYHSHYEAIANPTDFFTIILAFTPLHRLVLVGLGLTALAYMLQHGAAATQRLLAAAPDGVVIEAYAADGETVIDLVAWPIANPTDVHTLCGAAPMLGL